jgi:urease accessory protein
VLDDMVLGLGLRLSIEQRAFEPEAGAYHGTSGHGTHSHGAGDAPEPHTHHG